MRKVIKGYCRRYINWRYDQRSGKWSLGKSIGGSDARGTYTVNGRILGNCHVQLDLGLQVHSYLNGATQVNRLVKKAFIGHVVIIVGPGNVSSRDPYSD